MPAPVCRRLHVPKCPSVCEVCTPLCVQIGGTENTRVHLVCQYLHMRAGAWSVGPGPWREEVRVGLVSMRDPGGDFLRDKRPAPSATCCPRQLDAGSVFRGRRANFLSPLSGLRLSCLPGLEHAVFVASLDTQAAFFCQEPGCKGPLRFAWSILRGGGHPSPTHASQLLPGHAHLSFKPALDMAQGWPLVLAFPGHSDTCPLV